MVLKSFSDVGIQTPPGAGGNVKTICPVCSSRRKNHQDKCLSVNITEGIWNCHHCGWKGTLKTGQQEYSRPDYKPLPKPTSVLDWFKNRKIPASIIEQEQIGYSGSTIMFPFVKGGQVVNIKHRTMDKQFRQEKNAEKCLYRFDIGMKAEDKHLIITEGEIDALSYLVAGFKSVVSIPDGAPTESSGQFTSKFNFLKSAEPIFEKYNKIIISTDADAPGRAAERELARRIGVEKCWRVKYPDGCKDANDVLKQYSEFKLIEMIETASPYPVSGIIAPDELEHDVLALYDAGKTRGQSTGWPEFDKLYTIRKGDMTIITGIPGSGKSNFLDSMLINLITKYQWPVAVFSPENWPPERHMQTLIEKLIGKPFLQDTFNSKRMTRDEVAYGIEEIRKHLSFIMPKDEIVSVDSVLDKARVTILRNGVKGVVIDPWNEIEHNYKGSTEAQYLSQELTKIRRFARLNGVHVWIVAHPRNLVKDKNGAYQPPTMYEISGGAHWRNKADNGLCVHRPDVTVDETIVYIQKIRFKEVGRIGNVKFRYNRDCGRYFDVEAIGM